MTNGGGARGGPGGDEARKFFGLEALRFLAAFAVLVWHFQHFFFNPPDGDPTPFTQARQPFFGPLSPFYEHGAFAVQVFWALSGFIFFFKYGQAIHERRVSFRDFVVFRFSRLYPLHLATLILVAALQVGFASLHGPDKTFVYPHADALHFVLNLFMIPHWGYQQGFSFNAPVWSVSVEEFCYLAFFLIASAFAFRRWSLLGLFLASWVLLTSKVFTPDFGECLCLFLVGGVLYHVHAWLAGRGRLVERACGVLAAGAVVVVGYYQFATPPAAGTSPLVTTTIRHYVFVPALILAFVCLWTSRAGAVARASERLGRLTYSTYMIHFPVQLTFVLITDSLGWRRDVFYRPEALGAFLTVTLALGAASYRWLEAPAQRALRRRLGSRRPAIPATHDPGAPA